MGDAKAGPVRPSFNPQLRVESSERNGDLRCRVPAPAQVGRTPWPECPARTSLADLGYMGMVKFGNLRKRCAIDPRMVGADQ